jgi:hypothetical protein
VSLFAHYLHELAGAAASTAPAAGGLLGRSAADERRGGGVGGIFDGADGARDGHAAVPLSVRGAAAAAAAGSGRCGGGRARATLRALAEGARTP